MLNFVSVIAEEARNLEQINLTKPREISQSRVKLMCANAVLLTPETVNGHFGRRLQSLRRELTLPRGLFARESEFRRNPGAADAVPRSSVEDGKKVRDRSYARAENKRATGGSRRAIFGIPTPGTT